MEDTLLLFDNPTNTCGLLPHSWSRGWHSCTGMALHTETSNLQTCSFLQMVAIFQLLTSASRSFLEGTTSRCLDMVSMEEYMALEVLAGYEYNAICADLWSCGKMLHELCCLCGPSMQTAFLVDILTELMTTNPFQCPTMQEVLNRMVAFQSPLFKPCLQTR